MPQRRPKPDAISLERKLQPEPLPPLPKNRNGGVLDTQAERSYHHAGALPDLSHVECLPPTQGPIRERTQEEEEAMEGVMEGRGGDPKEEAYQPPVDVPFGGEGPAERFD